MPQDLNQLPGMQGPVDLNSLPGLMPTELRQGPENNTNWVEDFLHQATGGLSDKAEAALKASGAIKGGVKADTFSDRYHSDLTNVRNDFHDYEAANPGWAGAKSAKAAGVIAPMLATGPGAIETTMAKAALKSGATGAGIGAAYGFGGTNDESLGQDLAATGVGAAAGGVAGTALPVGLGIAKAPFRVFTRPGGPIGGSVFGREGGEVAAGRILKQAKTGDSLFEPAPLPDMKLTAGQASNDPGLLWLERNVSQATPEGATKFAESLAANNKAIRSGIEQLGDPNANASEAMRNSIVGKLPQTSASDQVLDLARTHLGDSGFHDTANALHTSRASDAAPLYEKAFAGGSIAPLKDQLSSALSAATGAKGTIARQIKAMEENNASALASRGAAGADVRAKYMQLHEDLKQAEADRQAALSVFQRAKSDVENNTPGAVWSPRIQQFIDDPIVRSGLNKGLQIQRLEALAAGKKFNPNEYAVTGVDEHGNHVISGVPNMRLLDAGKKGLDNIVEGYRNPITGKLALDQYGNAVNQVRASYVKELDSLNPDYAAARGSWSGPSQSLDALHAGRGIFQPDSELTAQRISSLKPGDLHYFKTGVLRAIDDVANNSPSGATALNSLLAKPNVQTKLTAAFGSPEAFQKFRQHSADILNPQSDIGKVTARDKAGNFTLPTSGVADQFIRTGKGAPEAFNSYLKTIAVKDPQTGKISYDPEGLKAAQDAFGQKFLAQVSNTGQDANGQQLVSPAKMQKFLTDYRHIINSPAFSVGQRDLVDRIAKATQMASRTANARPPGGGSDTFPKLQGDKFIDALVGPGASKLVGVVGKLGGAVGGFLEEGKMGAAMGFLAGEKGAGLINDLYKAPRDKVVSIITEAMHDPQLAKDLMMKASNSNAKLLPPPRRAKIFGVLGAQASQPVVNALTAPQ